MLTIPDLTLNDGRSIPQLGFGTFLVPPDETADVVRAAFEAGYRHIDTAEMYDNERGVGEAIRSSGLAREDVYVTSKLRNSMHRPDDVHRAFKVTMTDLGLDYVDLFLIHWPMPMHFDGDFASTWQAMEDLVRDGRCRSIGVSNFTIAHLERLAGETDMVPAVNQIEVHPYFGNDEVRAYGEGHAIITEAWSPLARGKVISDPVVTAIAERLGRTVSQVTLRWHVQRGDIIFPKSMSAARMRENLDIFSFGLDSKDMAAISGLDQGEPGRIGPVPETMDWLG